MYTQLAFVIVRVKALAPEHPEWQEQQPFKALLEDDLAALQAIGIDGVTRLLAATHANMTTTEFGWILVSMKRDWSRVFPAAPEVSPVMPGSRHK
jgi:hypothetical protein